MKQTIAKDWKTQFPFKILITHAPMYVMNNWLQSNTTECPNSIIYGTPGSSTTCPQPLTITEWVHVRCMWFQRPCTLLQFTHFPLHTNTLHPILSLPLFPLSFFSFLFLAMSSETLHPHPIQIPPEPHILSQPALNSYVLSLYDPPHVIVSWRSFIVRVVATLLGHCPPYAFLLSSAECSLSISTCIHHFYLLMFTY